MSATCAKSGSRRPNSGQLVSTFLNATDADTSALRGVALTGLTSGNGTWQYSINNRASWISVGSVSEASALLLRSTDYIRFIPNGSNGTTADISYHAWDQTSGAAGTRVNATANGGETAFSTATATASILVSDVNDAPVAIASSASGTEDGPAITGTVQATDVDSTTLSYALVANSAVGGASRSMPRPACTVSRPRPISAAPARSDSPPATAA